MLHFWGPVNLLFGRDFLNRQPSVLTCRKYPPPSNQLIRFEGKYEKREEARVNLQKKMKKEEI